MAGEGFDILSVVRVKRLMKALTDVRDLPGDLKFLARTPIVPAEEGEIMGRWIDRPQTADLVADDAEAAVYSTGKFSLETTEVPNIKYGRSFTQSQINLMRRMAQGVAMSEDRDGVKQGMFDIGAWLLYGIRDRMEQLCISMRTDRFSYDRGGLVIPNLSWGMPIQLNTVAGTPWYPNPGSATPIDNMLQIKLVMSTLFGLEINRVTMSTAAFRGMLATTEFANKAKVELRSDLGVTVNYSLFNLDKQRFFATNVLGMEIELYDRRSWTQGNDGSQQSYERLPANLVVLECSQYDNDDTAWDFANGVVTESIVGPLLNQMMGMPNGMIGQFDGATRGPTGYVTGGLNPPKLTMFGVARGFPRKHLLQVNAVLDIGTVVNPIPVTEVFGDVPGYGY